MKIIIVSDSHGKTESLHTIVSNYKFDYLFFLGDGIADLGSLIYCDNVKFVKGNNDYFINAPFEEVFTINNKTFLLTHGHNEKVKSGLGGLIKRAKEVKANFVFFGHTHMHYNENVDDVVYLNPGSLSTIRGGKGTFVMMNIENEKTYFELIEI